MMRCSSRFPSSIAAYVFCASLFLLASAASCPAVAAPAGNGTRPAVKNGVPTTVLADSMAYDESKRTVTFRNDVHVTRENMELWSDTLTVHMHPAASTGNGKTRDSAAVPGTGDVKRIVAQGHVRMKSDNRTGTCETAIYEADKEMLILKGNPVLSEPERQLTGSEIRYYIKDGHSECISKPGERVKAVFIGRQPPEQGSKKINLRNSGL